MVVVLLVWVLKTLARWPVFLAAAWRMSWSQGVESLFAVDVEVLVADHVGDEEGLDLQGAVGVPLGGQVAGAVEGVGGRPGLDGLFAVVEDQPDGVALRWMGAEVLAELDEQSGGAGAVVGADEVDVLERVVGFVVAGENDDAVFFAGVADDVVAHGRADRSVGGGELSVSKLPLAASGLKWSLMNFSAARWPGEPLKRLGATARNCWVRV